MSRVGMAVMVVGLFAGTARAASWNWDGTTNANFQAATGKWETATFWTTNGTALTTWPGSTTDTVIIQGAGTNLIEIDTTVTVQALSLAPVNGVSVIVTNGLLTVGAGGIAVAGNVIAAGGEVIYSALSLAASQTWTQSQNLAVYGQVSDAGAGFGFSKQGAGTLLLGNPDGSPIGGAVTHGGGSIRAAATNGLPFGSGSLVVGNLGVNNLAGSFVMAPAGTGGTAFVAGGTNTNSTITFGGVGRIALVKGTWTNVQYTFGNAADTGSVFVRSGRGVLGLCGSGGNASLTADGRFFLAATNEVNMPYVNPTNGVADPYLFMAATAAQWPVDLMRYHPVAGFTNVAWTTLPAAGTNNPLGLYTLSTAGQTTNTGSSSVYGLRYGAGAGATNYFASGVTITIGDGVRPAALLFANSNGATVTNVPGATGTGIDFRGSEGVILFGAYDNSIWVPLAGSNGLTIAGNGNNNRSLMLGAANTLTGVVTVMGGGLTLTNGGSLAAGAPVQVIQGGNLLIGPGAVVNDNVTALPSKDVTTPNVINSGTIVGTLSISSAATGPTYNFGNNGIAGYARLTGGSVSGPITANGRLDVTGPVTMGVISGTGTNGMLVHSSTASNSFTFQGGSSFSLFQVGANNAQAWLQQTGTGGVYFAFWGYNTATPGASHVFNGGTWSIGRVGQNNTGTQTTGTNLVTAGASVTISAGGYEHGTWIVNNGSLVFNGNIAEGNGNTTNCSLVLAASGAGGGPGTLTINGGLTLAGGTTNNWTNTLTAATGGTVTITGVLTLGNTAAATAEYDGVFLLSGGTLVAQNTIQAATPTNGQTRIFEFDGGTLRAAGNFTFGGGALTGGIRGGGARFDTDVRTITVNAPLAPVTAGDGGVTKLGPGTLTFTTNNTYSGPTRIEAGTLRLSGGGGVPASTSIVVLSGASLVVTGRIDGTLAVSSTQTLSGAGTVTGIVNNDGVVAPGEVTPGTLTIVGNYTQTNGLLRLRIGTGVNDVLAIGGSATLGGILTVSLDGYTPATNDSFVLATASAFSGGFATTNLPSLPVGEGWSLVDLGGALLLSVTGAPTGGASGYDLWAGAITNGLTNFNESATLDGYPNLLKYATGSNPTNADTLARLGVARSGGFPALLFNHNLSATDVTIMVFGNLNLTDELGWVGLATNAAGSWGGATNVAENTNVTPASVLVADPSATNRFFRLRVTRP